MEETGKFNGQRFFDVFKVQSWNAGHTSQLRRTTLIAATDQTLFNHWALPFARYLSGAEGNVDQSLIKLSS